MTPPFPKALVFDWDNTLVDSWDAIAEAMNYMLSTLNRAAWTLDEVKTRCTRAARESFPEWFGDEWKKAYDIYYQGFDAARKKRNVNIRQGSAELLAWLKAQQIPAFVVSNKRGDYLRQEADRLKWTHYFQKIVGAQDSPKDKPAREHVDFALADHKIVAGRDVWFIGDSDMDMLCAQNAGCTSVLIGSPHDAERHKADLVFPDCQALQSLLTSFPKDPER